MCAIFFYKYLTHQGLRIYAILKWSFYLWPDFHRKFLVSSEVAYVAVLPPLTLSAGLILFSCIP